MKRKFIPVEESFAKWKKEPGYVAAYALLEEEFALASSLIKARSEADMTQEQVAQGNGNNPGCGGASGERKGTTRRHEHWSDLPKRPAHDCVLP